MPAEGCQQGGDLIVLCKKGIKDPNIREGAMMILILKACSPYIDSAIILKHYV